MPLRRGRTAGAKAPLSSYGALDAILVEHRLCRPDLNEPDVSEKVVAPWCESGARLSVTLP
jgi:hypothetical protein